MPDPVTGVMATVSAGGSLLQSGASKKATKAQTKAADQGIAEQRRQFEALQSLMRPYVDAGGPALRGLMDLAGLGTPTTNWTAYANSNPALMAAYQRQVAQSPSMPGNAGQPYGLGDSPTSRYNSGFFGNSANANSGIYNLSGERIDQPTFDSGMYGSGDFLRGVAPEAYSGGAYGNMAGTPMSLEQFAQDYYRQNGGDISQFQDNPQARAVAQIEGQPMFQSIARQGEDAILQNASATGGLRGGNTQGALARFRPQLLNQFIEQQYARLAGITELGQNAAAGVGSAGLSTGANIGSLLSQQGRAQAAGAGAQGQIFSQGLGQLGGLFASVLRSSSPSPQARLLDDANNTINSRPDIF